MHGASIPRSSHFVLEKMTSPQSTFLQCPICTNFARMTIQLQAVAFRSPQPRRAAQFWGALLGRLPEDDNDEVLLAGESGQVGLRFVPGAPHGKEKNRLHLHIADGNRGQRDTIAASLELGARLLGNGHVPANSYAIMADVVGDEFCVIEDANHFLAGCGPLGEVTCDGTRAVGVFWSSGLGWPLAWDEGEETSIQSPVGGTKISWSGEPVNTSTDPDRQYFVLTVPRIELDDEASRLLTLGASGRINTPSGVTVLLDPDGNKFAIHAT